MGILKVGDKGYIGRYEPKGIPIIVQRNQARRFHPEELAFRYAVMFQEILNRNGVWCTVNDVPCNDDAIPKMLIERRLELSKSVVFWMSK